MIRAGEGVRMWIRKFEVMIVGEQSSKSLLFCEVGVALLFDEPNLMIMYILAYACKLRLAGSTCMVVAHPLSMEARFKFQGLRREI